MYSMKKFGEFRSVPCSYKGYLPLLILLLSFPVTCLNETKMHNFHDEKIFRKISASGFPFNQKSKFVQTLLKKRQKSK